MKPCTVGIRRPEERSRPAVGQSQASVWFLSMATVLSKDNRSLLRAVRDQWSRSLTALTALTGRRVPNLSCSLWMMEGYGLVRPKRDVHGVEPVALVTRFKILID
jgi:predicted transcriptional regulator